MYRVVNGQFIDLAPQEIETNGIVFSMFKELDYKFTATDFSIKYVLNGVEKYTINGNNYSVGTGQYLLTSAFCEGKVNIDDNATVKGICIHIKPKMLSEVLANFIEPRAAFADIELDTFFNSENFLENLNNAQETGLGKILNSIALPISSNPFYNYKFEKEFYYGLCEKIVQDYFPIYSKLQAIPTIKLATKKVLYRRVVLGKEFMDEYFYKDFNIETVAKAACLSEYHFFRLFKTTFGISPRQYLIKKRLNFSHNLLEKNGISVSEAALLAGYNDIFSFSKAFKNLYGYAPSCFIKK